MDSLFRRFSLLVCLILLALPAFAADKIEVTINKVKISAFRTVDLAKAEKEAAATKKPIAWIASAPKLLEEGGPISGNSSRGATLHAFYSLRDKAVLVFMDAYEENHKVLKLVDDALHTPNPHYVPPGVVFTDPESKKVLATVAYEKVFEKRAQAMAAALAIVKKEMAALDGKN